MKLASFISILLEPMIVLYVVALMGGKHANLSPDMWSTYAMWLTIFFILVYIVRMFFVRKDHTNWDISDRKKRLVPLAILTVFVGVLCLYVRTFGHPVLTSLFVSMLFWSTGFLLITLKMKVSGHVGVLTFALCQIIAWYGIGMVPLVLLIPPLAWSRLVLKRHTMIELIGGVVYSAVLIYTTKFLLLY